MKAFLEKIPPWMLCVIGTLIIIGCASLGVPPADTFNKKAAATYTTIATVADSSMALHRAGKITLAERQDIGEKLMASITAIETARTLFKTDPAAANDRLQLTITALTALRTFLITKQGSPS